MERNSRVAAAVFKAVDELNKQLPKDLRLDKRENTALAGESGKLDSLAFVNLIVITEQKIEEEFSVSVNLTDELLFSSDNSPFETIGSFIDQVSLLVTERAYGRERT